MFLCRCAENRVALVECSEERSNDFHAAIPVIAAKRGMTFPNPHRRVAWATEQGSSEKVAHSFNEDIKPSRNCRDGG